MKKKPYIMHIIDSLSPGGAERIAIEIANATDSERYNIAICVTRRGSLEFRQLLKPHVQLICLERKARLDMQGILKFTGLIRNKEKILLHIHGRSSFLFVIAAKIMGRLKAPLILHDHYGEIEIDQSVPLWFKVFGYSFVAKYVGVCDELVDWAVKAGIPCHKVSRISNALDLANSDITDYAKGKAESPKKRLIGLFTGNIRPQKDIENLILAVAKIEKRENFLIKIVGNITDRAYYEKCAALINQHKLKDSIIFVGPRINIAEELKEADFGIISARSESGPLALIEYMAVGLPFVSTKVGYVPNLVSQHNMDEFVPAGDSTTLSKAIIALTSLTPEERIKRGQEGKEVARRFFDITSVIKKWYTLYEELLTE